ncbi:MAG TPA: VWA domain-containing protein [Bryobacterales bacterium]|jgi:Ca-activated chloride channel family protein|nr:VWA domain-containing protein [Bryobacterales bacterium]
MRTTNRFRNAAGLGLFLLLGFSLLAQQEGPLPSAQGPERDAGESVARPKKKSEPPPAARPKRPPIPESKDMPTFKSESNLVTVDVAVLDSRGNFIPNIPREKFRILEDNVPQKIVNFGPSEAPMTVCMVIEFSNLFQQFWTESWYQTLSASYGFLQTLRPEDWVAVVAYDLKPEILSDFSQDKSKAYDAMRRLQIAAFSESNLYDALADTIDRMKDIEGRKAIVLISSGIDTFSKLTFDKIRRIVQTGGTAIYAIGLMQALREWYDAAGMMGPIQRLNFLEADNQMNTFARESGGMAFFPRFYGEFPTIFQQISASLRNQYRLTYEPSNAAHDGKFRKIKVQLIDPQTNKELRIVDQKGKNIKYQILAKAGYIAPREVE